MSVHAVSVADVVTERLRGRLLAGEIPPGSELRDTDLAAEFSVARPTIRSAIQALVAVGLLERAPGHSARVRAFSPADAIDLCRARRPIELEAVRLLLAGPPDLSGVEEQLQALRRLRGPVGWDRVADADVAFHRAVVRAAGSPRLLRLFDSLEAEMRLLIAHLRPAYRDVGELSEEHRLLLEVLRHGALRPAVKAWSEHLDAGAAFFLQTMKDRTS